MPEEVICAGGVVLRGEKFLAMKRFNGVWLLPKGHVDPGETLEETAVREVAEETGLKAQLGPKLGKPPIASGRMGSSNTNGCTGF